MPPEGVGAANTGSAATVTLVEASTRPPPPVQASVNVALRDRAIVTSSPEVARSPAQSPVALQVLASVAVQVRRLVDPVLTLDGLAVKVNLGGGAVTATAALREMEPPGPVQVSENVVAAANAAEVSLPDVFFEPLQPPVAAQLVEPVALHSSSVVVPRVTLAGVAVNDRVGAAGGATTATVVVAMAVPPAPVQLSVKLVPALSAAVDSVPAVVRAPLQPPVALQAVALVEDQVRTLVPPGATETGLADSVAVGAEGGGGGGVTCTVAEPLPVPPVPVQVRV